MKAIAVYPGKPNSVHLAKIQKPSVDNIPTGGNRKVEVPADKINLEFVLGNKVMVGTVSASRENYERGVKDLAQAEVEFPGWLSRLLTHPVKGLENYSELFDKLTTAKDAIKVYCKVVEF